MIINVDLESGVLERMRAAYYDFTGIKRFDPDFVISDSDLVKIAAYDWLEHIDQILAI